MKKRECQDKVEDGTNFWSICPICGEDAVIGDLENLWMCTDCGAYVD